MAISFADALPPEQAEISVPQGAERATLSYRNYKIHLIGAALVPRDALQRDLEKARDLSDATRLIAARHEEAGYPASRLHYMLVDEELFVVVRAGQVVAVDGPETLTRYFKGIEQHQPLRDIHIESACVLASVHADRMGTDVAAAFQPEADGLHLRLLPYGEPLRRTRLSASFGNPGNRFTGRHFADVEARRAFATGDEFVLAWQTSLGDFNDSDGSEDYDDYALGWSRVTTAGLFGLSAQLTEYDFGNSGTPMGDARITQVEGAWLYPFIAGRDYRWIVNVRLDYTHKEAELNDGTRIQDEEYASAETGLDIVWETQWREIPLVVEGGAQVRKGLGDDEPSTLGEADLGYLMLRPRVLAGALFGDAWDFELSGDFQLTKDTVPEQSQWVLGGVDNLTAYLPGVAVGDSGGLLRTRLSYLSLPSILGVELVPGAFIEYGYSRFEQPAPGTAPRGTVELADAGAQLELRHRRWLRAQIAIARGIGDSGIARAERDDSAANFFFKVKATF